MLLSKTSMAMGNLISTLFGRAAGKMLLFVTNGGDSPLLPRTDLMYCSKIEATRTTG